MNVKIINEVFKYDETISINCYRLIAEKASVRSFDFLTKYLSVNFWKGKTFCGATCFYAVPDTEVTMNFTWKYKNYFNENFIVGFSNSNESFEKKINQFNTAKRLNLLLTKYNKPLKNEPKFKLKELIDTCDIVFIEEIYRGHNGCSLLFFESKKIDSRQYIIDYFKGFDIDVIDET